MSDTTGKNIQSVQRAIDILNCFSENSTQLTLSDISVALNLNKSTVHGIVSTLKHSGYLWQSRSGKYLLGPSLLSKYIFADDSRKALIVHNAKSHMEFLVKKYNYSAKLYYLNEGTPNYIYHISPVNSTHIRQRLWKSSLVLLSHGQACPFYHERRANYDVFKNTSPQRNIVLHHNR